MRPIRRFTSRSARTFTLLRAVLLGTVGLSSSLAGAQSGTFKLPTQARWGNVSLPAGDYSYSVETEPVGKITTIRSQEGKWGAMVLAQSVSEPLTVNNQLVLTKRGEQLYVSALCLKDPGMVLNYQRADRHGCLGRAVRNGVGVAALIAGCAAKGGMPRACPFLHFTGPWNPS